MSGYEFLHEAEDIWLLSDFPRAYRELVEVLPSAGFSLNGDVYVVPRVGTVPIWQSQSALSVCVLLGEDEIYDDDGIWDRLKLRYLLATLPAEVVMEVVAASSRASDLLSLPIVFRGDTVTESELLEVLQLCIEDLRENVGEPGSKGVRATIEMTYPRR